MSWFLLSLLWLRGPDYFFATADAVRGVAIVLETVQVVSSLKLVDTFAVQDWSILHNEWLAALLPRTARRILRCHYCPVCAVNVACVCSRHLA